MYFDKGVGRAVSINEAMECELVYHHKINMLLIAIEYYYILLLQTIVNLSYHQRSMQVHEGMLHGPRVRNLDDPRAKEGTLSGQSKFSCLIHYREVVLFSEVRKL